MRKTFTRTPTHVCALSRAGSGTLAQPPSSRWALYFCSLPRGGGGNALHQILPDSYSNESVHTGTTKWLELTVF